MDWDLNAFNDFCMDKGFSNVTVYVSTLNRKSIKALIFANKSEEIWEDFWKSRTEFMINNPEDVSAFKTAQLNSEMYMEAALQNIHSILDVLNQIINLLLLDSELTSKNVTYNNVKKGLSDRNINNIKEALKNLYECQEFTYIADFVNTIKHRHLIDTDYKLEIGLYTKNTMGVHFVQFSYDSRNHKDYFAKEIINNYTEVIGPLISKVGKEIEISLSR